MIAALILSTTLWAHPQPSPGMPLGVMVRVASRQSEPLSKRRGALRPVLRSSGGGILYLGRCLVRNGSAGYDSYPVERRKGRWSYRQSARSFLPPKGPPCTPDYSKPKIIMVF